MTRPTFISHRHADAEIAQTLRNYLVDWGIKDVFLSSYPQSGLKITGDLNNEIRDNLLRAKLVVLIFTHENQDWSWCAYECGLASEPKEGRTNLIIIQCTSDKPRILDHKYLVKLTQRDIVRFCHQIHKDDDIWPGVKALDSEVGDDDISRRAQSLLDDLTKAVPRYRREERSRWDCFSIEMDEEAISLLESLSWDDEAGQQKIHEIVVENASVHKDYGLPEYHFGYDSFPEGIKLDELVQRWRSRIPKSEAYPDGWIDATIKDLWLAATNRPAEATWHLFRSVWRQNKEWLTLSLSSAIRETDGRMTFRFYCYLVPGIVAESILRDAAEGGDRSEVVRLRNSKAS